MFIKSHHHNQNTLQFINKHVQILQTHTHTHIYFVLFY